MRHDHAGCGRRDERPDPIENITGRERGERRRRPEGGPWAAVPDGWDGPRRGRRGGRGFGPRGGWPEGPGGPGFGFGPGGPHGFGGPRGHRGRAGRGDTRAAILLLLAEQPMHGYQLIQEIAQRTEGRWRPSPGAVYPALSALEDEGLVSIERESGRKLARLTEAGGTYVTQRADELGDPWQAASERPEHPGRELHRAVGTLAGAAEQVARAGTPHQVERAVAAIDAARRELYRLLADDPTGEPARDPGTGPGGSTPTDAGTDAGTDEGTDSPRP
ncbi:PadR family transcriptional regulator [Cellulomonas sp. PSBB021]|uniref:PadR family transcriptional regulator n=1 Tax=Cellulomonas sp. PSBB021 TaxID=2003551 RepID=UPI000B8D85E9|nr:PadR family transcriptional regulator [Cellulomonas sp. PSBB021]ASR55868.1 PadR family transcriptional regulator [Cellulomonas sp. PSBB021]